MMKDPINKMIMDEIGLTVDRQQRVIDQDTGNVLKFGNKDLKYSYSDSVAYNRDRDIILDVTSNRKLIETLFGYFTDKLNLENGVVVYGFIPEREDYGKSSLKVTTNEKVFSTASYTSNCLKYLDAIIQLNGSAAPNLSVYDITREEPTDTTKKRRY